MKQYEKELEMMESEIEEMTENRNLLKKVLETKEIEDFETISEINEVKRIFSEGEADGMLCIAEDRSFYEIKTETSTFLVMVEFLDMKEEVIEKYFYFYTDIYQLYTPKISKEHVETILKFVRNILVKNRDEESNSVQILNMYQKEFKEKEMSSEKLERLRELADKKEKEQERLHQQFLKDISC